MKISNWIMVMSCIGLFVGWTAAFEPSTGNQEELAALKSQIAPLVENDNQALRSLYQQARDLQTQFKEGTTSYYLENLRDYLFTKLSTRKDIAKAESRTFKAGFLLPYQASGLLLAEPLHENCIGWYQTLDNLSFAYDFPTALTIAVWYRESGCGYYLPKNGDGPFQIVSKDYGTGTITRELFETTIKDFLEFSKKKIDRYNGKNPITPISLSYKNFSTGDLLKFSALYNGLSGSSVSGDILPAAPKYFYEKMPWSFENGKKNGLFLQFLRVIERELTQ